METNINTLSAGAGKAPAETKVENKIDNRVILKKRKIYTAKSAIEKKDGEKVKRLILSLTVIFAGLLFLANNFGILSFNISESVSLLFSLSLIVIGICLSSRDEWWPVGLAGISLAAVAVMTAMISL